MTLFLHKKLRKKLSFDSSSKNLLNLRSRQKVYLTPLKHPRILTLSSYTYAHMKKIFSNLVNSQHFHFLPHIDIPYLPLDTFLCHYIWVYQDTWLYHNYHQWIHYYTHNILYCQCKCHCHYMLLNRHIQLKRINYYVLIRNWGNLSFKNLQQFPGLASSSRQQLPALSGSSILVPVQRHSPGLFESSKQQPTTQVKKGP